MILISVGPVMFQIAPLNPQGIDMGGEVRFASHDVLGAEPQLEHTGYKSGTLEIKGVMFPETFGGMSSLEVIRAAKAAAVPLPVIRGDFSALGWFVIESSDEKHESLNQYGIGKEITVTLKLKQVGSPGIGLVGAIFSLFG